MGRISRTATALALSIASVLMAGCAAPAPKLSANQFAFEFHSQPEGAMLYWGSGTAIGAAPYASTFAVSPQKLAAEVVTEAFVVVWPSGARLETTKTWRPHDNKKWRFTFSRPPGAPGMDIDLKHAASLEAASFARAQAQRAEQQERDATAASLVDSYVKGRYGSNDRDTSIQGPDPAVTCDAQRLTIGPATMDQRYRINCR